MPARKPPQPIEPFLADLNSPDFKVRSAAVRGLGTSRNPDAVEPLLKVLKDKTITLRFLAVRGLGKLKDPRAIEPLIPLLNHQTCRIHRAVYEELVRFGDQAVPALIQALDHPNPLVRCGVAFCLGEIGDPAAVEPLHALLNDPDQWVRIRAARVIEQMQKSSG